MAGRDAAEQSEAVALDDALARPAALRPIVDQAQQPVGVDQAGGMRRAGEALGLLAQPRAVGGEALVPVARLEALELLVEHRGGEAVGEAVAGQRAGPAAAQILL